MLTREEFIDRHRHELAGMVVDAATFGEHGAPGAMLLRGLMKKIDARLATIYGELTDPPNGKPAVVGRIGDQTKTG